MNIAPFEYTEILAEGAFNEYTRSLSISTESTPKIILLRSIVGSIRIKQTLSQTEFDQSVDYLDLENKNGGVNPIVRLKNYISADLTIEEFSAYFSNKKFLYQNFPFFERLNNEFNNYY